MHVGLTIARNVYMRLLSARKAIKLRATQALKIGYVSPDLSREPGATHVHSAALSMSTFIARYSEENRSADDGRERRDGGSVVAYQDDRTLYPYVGSRSFPMHKP